MVRKVKIGCAKLIDFANVQSSQSFTTLIYFFVTKFCFFHMGIRLEMVLAYIYTIPHDIF